MFFIRINIFLPRDTVLFRSLHRLTACLPEIRFIHGSYPAITRFYLSQNNSDLIALFSMIPILMLRSTISKFEMNLFVFFQNFSHHIRNPLPHYKFN